MHFWTKIFGQFFLPAAQKLGVGQFTPCPPPCHDATG